MDGPDLSHLLETATSEKPPADVLQGIVRRHRRRQARSARTAASLGLVIALAGLGTGIGLSHQGRTTSAAGKLTPTSMKGGANTADLPSTTSTRAVLGGSTTLPLPAASKLRFGKAPAGLGWVITGFGAVAPVASATGGAPLTGQLHSTATGSAAVAAACTTAGCPAYLPDNVVGGATALKPLFTRTSGGVTVRAFSASWAVAPIELGPIASGSGSAGSGSVGSGSSSGPANGTSSSSGTATGTSSGSGTGVTATPPVTGTIPDTTTTTSVTSVPAGTDTTVPVSTPPPEPLPSCGVTQALVVEVSDAGAVGVVTVPLGSSLDKPLDVVMDEVVGSAEQSPMVVVVAHTNSPTASVRADFGVGGQDQMDVVDQWAVLVEDLGSSTVGGSGAGSDPELLGQASVSALASDGTVLEQAVLPGSGALAMPVAACVEPAGGVTKPVGAGASSPTAKHVGG
jgi:hypothetical protein